MNPDAELSYVLVAPIVTFREWALVAVRRPVERGGIALDSRSEGGAVYLFRQVAGSWRLLSAKQLHAVIVNEYPYKGRLSALTLF